LASNIRKTATKIKEQEVDNGFYNLLLFLEILSYGNYNGKTRKKRLY